MKQIVAIFFTLCLLSVSLLSGCGEQSTSEKPVKEEEQTMKKEKITEQDKIAQIETMLKEGLRDGADVEYDEGKKQFSVIMTNDKLKDSLNKIKENPADKKWPKLIKAFQHLSKQIESNLAKGYTIRLVEPDNKEQTMLTITDGKTTYDFAAQ
ncbi:hypothetical protein KKC_11953 [Listeria fleischmannii subsp. coloradonensis]|uniref:Lipoprotein n=1 Tax=Listeria fleischmannii TaxID=1069827 RepID=A0A841YFM2_9LIST|nr:hypothetical protein [Listeria fleischmannii]EIA19524.1 hypothetical protein KKC_11953 [Listeria fleischmannii subsp. coloradonensis]MBC1399033.1 hypothetical protein [Listeria fleischmannii]MBC1427286.1 hypothetical protein [Listeria fleischmannii]